jgi:hypothetical protein
MTASREQALGEANCVWVTELAIYVEPPGADPHARSCGRDPGAIRAPIPIWFVLSPFAWQTTSVDTKTFDTGTPR